MHRVQKDPVTSSGGGGGGSLISQRTKNVLIERKQLPISTPVSSKPKPISTPVSSKPKPISTPVSSKPISSSVPSKRQLPDKQQVTRVAKGSASASVTPKLGKLALPGRKVTPLATPNTRPLDKAGVTRLHKRLQLKNDVAMYKEDLIKEVKNNTSLRDELDDNNRRLRSLQNEESLMMKQVQCLETEIKRLNALLNEERQCRQQTETKTQEHLSRKHQDIEIQTSSLLAEISLKDNVIKIKSDLISQLEDSIKSLRQELTDLKEKNASVQDHKSVHMPTNSKSFRGSISNMQATLTHKLEEVDKSFQEMEKKHQEDLKKLQNDHEVSMQSLRLALHSKEEELEECRGRLHESRQARDCSLLEMKKVETKCESTVDELRSELEQLKTEMSTMRQSHEVEENYSVQVEVLEGQLAQTIRMNSELSRNFEAANEELDELRQYIDKQNTLMVELSAKLEASEAENKELLQNIQEKKQTTVSSSEELAITQEKLVASEAIGNVRNVKLQALEKQFGEVTKKCDLMKVDLRVLRRENKDLKETVSSLNDSNSFLISETKTKEQELVILKEAAAESIVWREKFQEKSSKLLTLIDAFEEMSKILQDTEEELEATRHESREKTQIIENLAESFKEAETKLAESKTCLETAQRKIESQKVSIGLLREACSVLDAQLKEFETTYLAKQTELNHLQALNRALEEEKTSLKDALQKLKVEINEVSSLRVFYETRYKKAEDSLKSYDKRYMDEIKTQQQKLQDTTSASLELNSKVHILSKELEQVKLEKTKAEQRLAALQDHEDSASKNLVAVSKQVAELVDENSKLATALSNSSDKAEDYKNRYEALCSHQEIKDHEKIEKDVQLKSTIRQQAKLIEYLQQQNEILIRKKEKKFQIFGKTQTQSCSSHKIEGASSTDEDDIISLTPVHLIKEHFNVQKLEQTAESLRAKLTNLQEEKKKTDSPIRQIRHLKEECILLKNNNATC